MNSARWWVSLCLAAVVCIATPARSRHFPGPAAATAQSSPTTELEASLFVFDPHMSKGRGISVAWIPQPIQTYCLGKTAEECSTIDYCIRTTNKQVAMCQKLSANLRQLPPYPADMSPRRMLSITVFYPMTPDHGFGSLVKFFENAPQGSLDHISAHAKIKAKVQLTSTPDDDSLQLLEVLSVPSS